MFNDKFPYFCVLIFLLEEKKTLSYTPKSIANNPRSIEKAIESLNAKKKKKKTYFQNEA